MKQVYEERECKFTCEDLEDWDEEDLDVGWLDDPSELSTKELGKKGEEIAAFYLEHIGYQVMERNWRCEQGEADIICMDPEDDSLVFVEVKTRRTVAAGFPEDSVTPKKRRKYEAIAMDYLQQKPISGCHRVRFDVIAIGILGSNQAFIRHHCSAFSRGD